MAYLLSLQSNCKMNTLIQMQYIICKPNEVWEWKCILIWTVLQIWAFGFFKKIMLPFFKLLKLSKQVPQLLRKPDYTLKLISFMTIKSS